ncbi:hypothetical protein LJR219_003312 [Phenylobacterium sp. LjRoot219]|uniref:hypothetical protein n=1 Tax=Phenylobacterium sp. LjRoot219 TaxID=3342283 RepID=UPI003ED17222
MRKLLLLAAAAAALAAPAQAQPRPDEPRPNAPLPRGRLFVSPSGEPFRVADGLSVWFAKVDADHDGRLTAVEFQADADRAFVRYDADRDGVLNGLEIQAYERDEAPEITEFAFADAPGERGGRGGFGRRKSRGPGEAPGAGFHGAGASGAARFSLLNEPQPLLAADEDVDGKVHRAEWDRASARRFARLDRERAGALTLAGLRPQSAKRRTAAVAGGGLG